MFLTIQKIHSRLLALGYHTDRLFKYEEGTDAVDGDKKYKKQLLTKSPLLNWAGVVNWSELKGILAKQTS